MKALGSMNGSKLIFVLRPLIYRGLPLLFHFIRTMLRSQTREPRSATESSNVVVALLAKIGLAARG